ncbi:MAG: FAD-binding oxidoreductase [bacterium]|nr:FAD-binding oxidoreductase [bacterium]
MIADPLKLAPRFEALLGAEWVTVAGTSRWTVEGLTPGLAVRPGDAEQVGAILRLCGESGAAVVPWGGGTAIEVGNAPRAAHVVLLTDRLSGLVEHDAANLTATVGAGMTLGELEGVISTGGQFFPLEPPRAESATAGGAVAANLNGPRRAYCGSTRDLVIGARAAQADGTLIKAGGKTVKNVAGYDMCKLLVGSLGTLGVLTELTLRLLPVPEFSRTVAIWGADPSDLLRLSGRVLASLLLPAAVTVVDAVAAGALGRNAAGLLVRATGFEAAVARQVRDVTAWAAQAALDVETLEGEAEGALWRTIRDFAWQGDGIAIRVAVPSGEVPPVLARLRSIAPDSTGVVAHTASGTIWIHADPAGFTAAALGALREISVGHSGNMLVARAPRDLKAAGDVWAPAPQVRTLEIMRAIKQAFDPNGILNPGRFVAGL